MTLHLYIADADRIVEGAAAAGATGLRPVKDEFYGDRTGMIADPFGHKWKIASPWKACPRRRCSGAGARRSPYQRAGGVTRRG